MALTKEQIEAIKANPELKELYDSMNADYTTKSQQNAAFKTLIDELGFSSADDLRDHLGAWQKYGEGTEPIMRAIRASGIDVNAIDWTSLKDMGTGQGDQGGDGQRQSPRGKGAKGGSNDDRDYYTKAEIAEMVKQFQTNLDTHYNARFNEFGRLLDSNMQLEDLHRQHYSRTGKFDMDTKKLVKHALDKKLADLKAAYDDFYHEDLVKKDVETELEKRMAEQTEAKKGKGDESGSHEAPAALTFPKEKPKGFAARTREVLTGFKDGSLPHDDSGPKINAPAE
jgi:hypothetical protein